MGFLKNLFRAKKLSDHALQDLIEGLKTILTEKLETVIVFGSYASGEFQEGKSGVNVMVLTTVLYKETLASLTPSVRAWTDGGHEPPVFLRSREFQSLSHVLPVEFMDMADHHRIVYGRDPFPELVLDGERLKFQVEHDLNTLLLKLRRSAVMAGKNQEILTSLLARSITSAWTLCRALLRLKGQTGPVSKIEAAHRMSPLAGFDAELVTRLDNFRRTSEVSQAESLFAAYLELVEKLLHYARTGAST